LYRNAAALQATLKDENYTPMIGVEWFKGQTKEQTKPFAAAVTASLVECCGGNQFAYMLFSMEISRERWATAGRPRVRAS